MKFVLALAVCFIVYCVFGYYCPVGESSCEMREDWYECYNPATEICCSDPESHGSGAICNATISQRCCYGTSISGEAKKILSFPVSHSNFYSLLHACLSDLLLWNICFCVWVWNGLLWRPISYLLWSYLSTMLLPILSTIICLFIEYNMQLRSTFFFSLFL